MGMLSLKSATFSQVNVQCLNVFHLMSRQYHKYIYNLGIKNLISKLHVCLLKSTSGILHSRGFGPVDCDLSVCARDI